MPPPTLAARLQLYADDNGGERDPRPFPRRARPKRCGRVGLVFPRVPQDVLERETLSFT